MPKALAVCKGCIPSDAIDVPMQSFIQRQTDKIIVNLTSIAIFNAAMRRNAQEIHVERM